MKTTQKEYIDRKIISVISLLNFPIHEAHKNIPNLHEINGYNGLLTIKGRVIIPNWIHFCSAHSFF